MMRKLLLTLFICCAVTQGIYSQESCHTCLLDSLLTQIDRQPTDTARVRFLALLVDKSNIANYDEVMPLIKQLAEANKDLNLVDMAPYNRLYAGLSAWKEGDYTAALVQIKTAIDLFDKKHKPVYELLSNMRVAFNKANQQEERKNFYSTRLDYYLINGPFENTAACFHGLGGYYLSKADYNLSITNYLRAASLYKRFNENYYINDLGVVGAAYEKWGNLEKAKYYLNLVLPLAKAKGDSMVAAYTLVALSRISLKTNNIDQALKYTNEAITYSQISGNETEFDVTYSVTLVQKAMVYIAQNHAGMAFSYLSQAKRLTEKVHPQITSTSGDLEIDYAFYLYNLLIKNYAAAEQYLLTASKKAGDENSNALEQKYLRELSRFYQSQNNPAKAIKYINQYFEVNDQLEKEQNSFKVAQFEKEEKEQQQNSRINSLRQEKTLQDVQIKNRNRVLLLSLAGLLIVCVLLAFIYRQLWVNKKTLYKLKKTQQQLILVGKMASLGELTGGIAHEIQNPLNFVQNFSEVTADLAGELQQELAAGRNDVAAEIANDIKANIGKILQHSKRAGTIVQGMLLHIKDSPGIKEMVDVNDLIDKYLRLSFSGVKANNKTFDADLKTNYDPALHNIEVMPRELGTVLLNLYNNAFYSVAEKKKKLGDGYEPTVWVSTHHINNADVENGLEIRIKDNGMGIPGAIKENIYHPLFTTKPTGQGTGLGLSLSFDIITKGHGGKMELETVEGEYAEFIITL